MQQKIKTTNNCRISQRNENFYFKVIAVKMRAYISSTSREKNLEKMADYSED